VTLDEASFFSLGVVFAPVPRIGAIDGLDRFLAANGDAAELRGRQFRAGHDAPCSVVGGWGF
jgi:hypothetical protein